ncbi:MAG: NfeD family protein [Pirellulales bacterium]|nr:NfeD family protein [Pirellulales bacterium]
MLDICFLTAAIIGGTVMACQFLMSVIGLGGESFDGDLSGGDAGAAGGDLADLGDLADGDQHTSWSDAADGELQHPDSSWLFGVLSFRSIVAALAFFGFSGLTLRAAEFGPTASLFAAVLTGLAAMFGMYYVMRAIMRLASSGNENIMNAVGEHATVYIPIPAARAGLGKVQLTMQNRIVEFAAVTDDSESIRTGTAVEVVAVNGHDTLEVTRIATPVEA